MKYKEKYNAALERASKLRVQNPFDTQCKKQGKSALETWKDMRLEVYQQASGNRHEPNYSDDTTKMFSLNDIDEIIEKMSEQTPADNVEPKFKVGDWIVNTHNRLIWQITYIRNSLYYLRDVNGNEGYETYDGLQDNYRLWSISDARDGDILACNKEILLFKSASALGYISLHCWYNGQTNRFHSKAVYDTLMTTRNKICPATKEQQDLFIQKMKEAGYEWNANKKELEVVNKESEDERTRKELIEQIAFITPNNDELDDECNVLPTYQKRIDKYRAWLEKQGKQLDPDKVIGWLVANICDYDYYVKLFKKDFGI